MSKHDPRPIQEVLEAVRQSAAKILETSVNEANLAQLKRKHKRHIDDYNKRNKDLPKKVEDELFKYAMDNDGIGDDPDDFDEWLVQNIEEKNLTQEEIDERAALVMNQTHIIDVVLKDLHALLLKQMSKGQLELMNNVARMVGLSVTTKGQSKNKAFMYDLEKGFKSGGRGGSNRGK